MKKSIFFALFVQLCCCEKNIIHFGAFISNIAKDDLCFKAAIDAAVQLINEDTTILKDFHLKVHYLDNFGMSGFGIKEFFKIREMKDVLQVLLGPFTEKYAQPIRELAKNMNLPMFEDNGETHQSQRKATIALLQNFDWKRVSILYDVGYLHFVKNTKYLKKEFKNIDIQANTIQGFSSKPYYDVKDQMLKIKSEDGRIIFLNMDKYSAPTIFCDAYLQNMTFPRRVFIAGNIEEMSDNWHSTFHDNTRRCTSKQIAAAAEGFVYLKRSDFQLSNSSHVAKKSRKEIWQLIKTYKRKSWKVYVKRQHKWKKRAFNLWKKMKYNKGSARAFDLVYRAALALDGLIRRRGAHKVLMTNYLDVVKYQQIDDAIKQVEFNGVSGRQRRMSVGHQLDHVIYQYRKGRFGEIGYYSAESNKIKFHHGRQLFKNGNVPRDGILTNEITFTYKTSIVYTMWIIAISGIILSISLLFLNWQFRRKRVIKMSSPKVNNLIILGCISCYVSIILYGVDTPTIANKYTNILCTATTSTLSIGFTLSFGGLFSKTWRVYRIFSAAKTNSKMVVRDFQLYIMIISLVSIDVCIITFFVSFNSFHLASKTLYEKYFPAQDTIEVTVHLQCHCSNYMSLLIALVVYKVVLLTFGLFMAWETRHVHIPVLNDSKHIGIGVYVVAFLSTIGTLSVTALSSSSHFEESYVVFGLCIFLCTTLTLLLVFFSKVTLIFDKTGRDRAHSTSSIISSSCSYHDNGMQHRNPSVYKDNNNSIKLTNEHATISNGVQNIQKTNNTETLSWKSCLMPRSAHV